MASRRTGETNYARRFFWFAAAIVLAGIGYTFFWNYTADALTDKARLLVNDLNRDGRRANCENMESRGYPFRIGLFCDSVMYVDAASGVSLRTGALRSAAQVYQPHRAIGELDGPAILEFPGMGALETNWSSLRASARLATRRPDLVSVEARDLVAGPDTGPAGDQPLFTARLGEFHMRPAGDGVDIAMLVERLSLHPDLLGDGTLPLISGEADIHFLSDPAHLFGGEGLRNLSTEIRNLTIRTAGNETAGFVQGPLSIDAAGLIDADLTLSLENPQVFASVLAELLPGARDQIRMGLAAASALGERPSLPLRIRGGVVSAGFFSLGRIPPV